VSIWYKPPASADSEHVKVLRRSVGDLFGEFWVARRALIIPALAYVGGLLVWSINANRNHLGSQVDASARYLVAGVVPAILILAAVLLALALVELPTWLRGRAETHPWLKPLLWGSFIISASVFVTYAVNDLLASLGYPSPVHAFGFPSAVGLAVFLVLVVGCLLVATLFEQVRTWALVYGLMGIVFFVIGAAALYMNQVYPRLPQSLGGGQTQCALLDIQTAMVSEETLAALAPQATDAGPTARTQEVDILFDSGDALFIRLQTPSDSPTIELEGDVLRAIISCP
jgi:hypothetical protein